MPRIQSGFADVNGARLYYELAGSGVSFVMIHAGIADCRMWEGEFEVFSQSHQTLRFDMRGYGKSLPLDGEFNIQDDLEALLAKLAIPPPYILMGCSIGGGLAIDFALSQPERVAKLILVGSDPAGLELEAESPDELFAQSQAAFEAGDVERVAELDMRIWFDGAGRSRQEANAAARGKAYAMAKLVIEHELKGIGTHVRKAVVTPAAERLHELSMPALIVIGENDLPYLKLAADYHDREAAGSHQSLDSGRRTSAKSGTSGAVSNGDPGFPRRRLAASRPASRLSDHARRRQESALSRNLE